MGKKTVQISCWLGVGHYSMPIYIIALVTKWLGSSTYILYIRKVQYIVLLFSPIHKNLSFFVLFTRLIRLMQVRIMVLRLHRLIGQQFQQPRYFGLPMSIHLTRLVRFGIRVKIFYQQLHLSYL